VKGVLTRPDPGAAPYTTLEIGTASFPEDPWRVIEARHWDASWDHTRYEFLRIMAEDPAGRIVAYAAHQQGDEVCKTASLGDLREIPAQDTAPSGGIVRKALRPRR